MIFLTFNAAVFHEFASSTYLEFHVIDRCFAAVGTYFVCRFLFVGSAHIIQSTMISSVVLY
jgi:hypothetical protein